MDYTITILGSGTSAGVPIIGCDCEVCKSSDPRDRRDRPGVMIRYHDNNDIERTFLIDTTPDLRHQMLRHQVSRLDGVIYTHHHADHIFGMDDLRRFNALMDAPLNIYGEPSLLKILHQTFPYIFNSAHNINNSFVANLIPHPIEPQTPFVLSDHTWRPLRLLHGRLPILGYRLGNIAYCTDCSSIPPETWPDLADLDILMIDALRYRHHPTHMTVDQALEVIEQVQPRRAYLTHISHEISHADLESQLPDHVRIAYDGLTITSPRNPRNYPLNSPIPE